jgi:twinkle protein
MIRQSHRIIPKPFQRGIEMPLIQQRHRCSFFTRASFTQSPSLPSFQTITNNINKHSKHQRIVYRHKVFVSRHNQSLNVTSNQIAEYCKNQGIDVQDLRTTTTHVILRKCPFCSKSTKGKADNMYKIYVQIGGGAYFCHRCGKVYV